MKSRPQSRAASLAFMRLASDRPAPDDHASAESSAELRVIEFTVHYPLPLTNALLRMREYERTRIKHEIAEAVHAAVLPLRSYGGGWRPLQRCRVTIELHRPGRPDWDGMMGALKYLLDALVVPTGRNPRGCSLIVDDSQDCIVDCPRLVPVCTGRGGALLTRVRVEEVLM